MSKNALRSDAVAFESLEARALLSGSGIQFDPAAAVELVGQAEIADADFLNPVQDDVPVGDDVSDATDDGTYDFGDAWGSNPHALTTADNVEIFPDDIDRADFGGPRRITPADVAATQNGTHEETLVLRDSTDEDVPQVDPADTVDPEDAPVVAPIMGTTPEAVWINLPATAEWATTIDSIVHADVVIESTFA